MFLKQFHASDFTFSLDPLLVSLPVKKVALTSVKFSLNSEVRNDDDYQSGLRRNFSVYSTLIIAKKIKIIQCKANSEAWAK